MRGPLDVVAPARAAEDPDGTRRGRIGRDQRDVVQPAVAREAPRPGHGDPPARPGEQVRLRGLLARPGRRGRDRGLRAGLPRGRGRLTEEAARPARAGSPPRTDSGRSASGGAARGRKAAARRRRARRAAPASVAPGGGGGADAARLRRAPRAPARARADDARSASRRSPSRSASPARSSPRTGRLSRST